MDENAASSLVGTVVDEVSFTVEAGKVREFVRATDTQDPVHREIEVAQAAGLPAIAATPTHVVVAGHQRDQRGFVSALGLDITRIVVGEVEWRYERPVVVGDQLTGIRKVVGDELRTTSKGGTLRLVTMQTEFTDQSGVTVVTQREVLVERGSIS